MRLEQKQLAVLQGAKALGAAGVPEVRLSNLGPADAERRDPVGIGDPEVGLDDCTTANLARDTTTDFPGPLTGITTTRSGSSATPARPWMSSSVCSPTQSIESCLSGSRCASWRFCPPEPASGRLAAILSPVRQRMPAPTSHLGTNIDDTTRIRWGSIYDFKHLEAPAVILTDVDMSKEHHHDLLYVGASRAADRLVVLEQS